MMNLDFANMIKRKFVDHPHYKSHAAMKQSLEYQQKMVILLYIYLSILLGFQKGDDQEGIKHYKIDYFTR